MKNEILKKQYEQERERILSLCLLQELTGDYTSPVFGEGSENASVMLIGEAPGREEAQQGRPFVGKAGKQLDELLITAQIDRESVFVTNSVKYRPTRVKKTVANRTPTAKEIKDSAYLLKTEIDEIQPKIIATLGNSPLYAISYIFSLGNLKIGDVHGQKIELSNGSILVPLYHPASVIYNRSLIEVLREDIKMLGKLMRE
ncbi:MAG: uracil-DNA glycosylase [Clostridia bacterium]|nr:uracil-DNA glycosylase [Clostridia bacterium]